MPTRPLRSLCRVPRDLDAVTVRADETPSAEVERESHAVDEVWDAVSRLYRTGLYPGIQICVRRKGAIVLHRSIGHARGNAPGESDESRRRVLAPSTPFTLFSASKAVTAMLVHKLVERGLLRLTDRVCDFIPEFAAHGKQEITLHHLLSHRAGIPRVPADLVDLALLEDREAILAALCDARPSTNAGSWLAYHAVSSGFVLGAVIERATGEDIRGVLDRELRRPLAMRWFSYGVSSECVSEVAENAFTGFPSVPPFSTLLNRVLGMNLHEAVELSGDPRFFANPIPSVNIVATAEEVSRFYQCLLDGGQWDGQQVFEPETVETAVREQSCMEVDLTLGLPIRYGLGFMLGGKTLSLYGPDTPLAFGHIGLTNIVSWADPERQIAAAILTSGKPFVNVDVLRVFQVLGAIGRSFPRCAPPGSG